MEITGHSTREMFDRYNTVDGDDTREAVNKLEDYFSNIDQNVDQNAISKKLTVSNMLNLGKNIAELLSKPRYILIYVLRILEILILCWLGEEDSNPR
jgi:hypothetical protein